MDIKETLNTTIEDAVNDSLTPETADTDTSTNNDIDVAPSLSDTDTGTDAPIDPLTGDVAPARDEFAERYGIQGQSFTGKENRIPYSRVKKIVAKAENDAKEALRKQLEGEFTPKYTDIETKVKDYEGRLEKVAQFEQILERDPQTFLGMLSKHPSYKAFFDQINQLVSSQMPQQPQSGQRDPQTGRFVQGPAVDPMPQPDKQFPDGTLGYSEEGLGALMDWNARNVEQRVISKVEQRYAPIEQDWQAQRRREELMPQIERQITEARQWDRFAELEPEIIQVLQQNPTMNLERAYMHTYQKNVVPKLAADRNTMRSEILAELKKAPVQTSAPTRSMKTTSTAPTGPRPIEDIIREEMEKASR